MRNIYKFYREGLWFSRNGKKAYLKGERPLRLWESHEGLVPTIAHHIAVQVGASNQFKKSLVMFYKKK